MIAIIVVVVVMDRIIIPHRVIIQHHDHRQARLDPKFNHLWTVDILIWIVANKQFLLLRGRRENPLGGISNPERKNTVAIRTVYWGRTCCFQRR